MDHLLIKTSFSMQKQDFLKMSGKEVFLKGMAMVSAGKLKPGKFRELCDYWIKNNAKKCKTLDK